ncbi:MAG: hypothetical protein RJR35_11065 [Thermoanaerobacterales bacterium]|nr:hypothetical protein [Thermoanaerobacterales bacterium]
MANIYLDTLTRNDERGMNSAVADDILSLPRHPGEHRNTEIAIRILEGELKLVITKKRSHTASIRCSLPGIRYLAESSNHPPQESQEV